MINISFSYYFSFREEKDNYIIFDLYEIVNTLKDPVISSNHTLLFCYCDGCYHNDNIFENNVIIGKTENENCFTDLADEDYITIEINKPVFENLKEKFKYIISFYTTIIESTDRKTLKNYYKITELINNLKEYIKNIGLIN